MATRAPSHSAAHAHAHPHPLSPSPIQILLRWSIERGVPALVRTADPAHAAEAGSAGSGAWGLTGTARSALDRLETRARTWRPDAAWPDPEVGGVPKPSLVLP